MTTSPLNADPHKALRVYKIMGVLRDLRGLCERHCPSFRTPIRKPFPRARVIEF